MLVQRIIALALLLIPGAAGVYGIKLMRDALFMFFDPHNQTSPWLILLGGLVLFIVGISFVAGYLYHREKRLGRLQKRLMREENVKAWLKKRNG